MLRKRQIYKRGIFETEAFITIVLLLLQPWHSEFHFRNYGSDVHVLSSFVPCT